MKYRGHGPLRIPSHLAYTVWRVLKRQWHVLVDYTHDHLNREALKERLWQTVSLFTVARKRNLLYLYTSHALSSWGDRLWKFAVPLSLAYIYPMSLSPIAIFSAAPLLFNFILGSYIGYIVDQFPRLRVVLFSLIVQNAGVALSALMVMLVMFFESDDNASTSMFPFSSWIIVLLFAAGAGFTSIAAFASQASSVSVLKDWAVIISQYHKLKLEDINATLRRIDLFCDILTPLVFSMILMVFNPIVSIATVSCWNVISFFPEFLLLLAIYRNTPTLSVPKGSNRAAAKRAQQSAKTGDQLGVHDEPQSPPADSQKKAISLFTILLKGWRVYFVQPVLVPSISFVFLYITVLTHGSVMIAFLHSKGMEDIALGIFRAVAAFYGLLATILSPIVIKKFGTRLGGVVGIWFQFISLTLALVPFLLTWFDAAPLWLIYIFLLFIVISRTGLWSFDLAETQIMQESVLEEHRGLVNSTEASLTKLAEFSMLMLTMLLSDPKYFIYLAGVSYVCVFISMSLYTMWCIAMRGKDISQAQEPEQLKAVDIEFMDIDQFAPGEDDMDDAAEIVFHDMNKYLDEVSGDHSTTRLSSEFERSSTKEGEK